MALKIWKCLECEQEFKDGDWTCSTGMQHRVELKRYYTADAPTVPEFRGGRAYIDKSTARTQILNIPPEKKIKDGDDVRIIPGGSIEFVRGLYETDDPEIQFHLDRKTSLCSEERWREVYLNDNERAQMKDLELKAREQRLEQRENELLASVKSGSLQDQVRKRSADMEKQNRDRETELRGAAR